MTADGDEIEPDPRLVPFAAVLVYALLLATALGWLGFADRLDEVPRSSIGAGGPLLDLGAGVCTGLVVAGFAALLARASTRVRAAEGRLRSVLAAPTERSLAVLVFCAAVAEQIAFRVAVQGAFGPLIAVAAQAAMSTGPGFWALWPIGLALAASTTALVHFGFGLAAAALAHALTLQLTLRRILVQ